jgi:lipopolysaccharide heptosyltransferase I
MAVQAVVERPAIFALSCYNLLFVLMPMRILIVKLSAIGDVVHTLPAAVFLKRALPDAHIAWAVERRAGAILKDSPVIDELIEVDTRRLRKNLFSGATLESFRTQLGNLRGNNKTARFDVAIDFQGLVKSGVVAKASQATRRIGFETNELREKFSRLFLTEQVPTSSFCHVIEKNLALALAVTGANQDSMPAYEFPIAVLPEDEKYVEETASNHLERFAIINPGGGWVTKLWPAENFGKVADWLWDECAMTSLVTYGPGEENLARAVRAGSRNQTAIPFPSTLKQFVALARRAQIFIGGDTGPLHIAAACGAPIVGLYGPTSPERNGPFDHHDITVGRDLWCRENCYKRTCWHWQCMDISVAEVTRAIAVRLNKVEIEDKTSQQQFAFNL